MVTLIAAGKTRSNPYTLPHRLYSPEDPNRSSEVMHEPIQNLKLPAAEMQNGRVPRLRNVFSHVQHEKLRISCESRQVIGTAS